MSPVLETVLPCHAVPCHAVLCHAVRRVGFNSVYHLTDVPGFVSGEHLVFFDPHCKYLPAISAANPGKKINFVNHPVNSKLADQVAPFHFFGCDTRQPFQGTLFRFPLRTQQQADASTISKQVRGYTSCRTVHEAATWACLLLALRRCCKCSWELNS